jgi:hypothetical protein
MVVAAIAALVAALGIVASRSESLRSLPTTTLPTSPSEQTTPIRITDDFGPAIASSAPASSRPPAEASMRLAQNTAGSPTTAAGGAGGIPACDQPGGLGLSRIVEIDTTGGPGFGFEHFKQYDFLRDREVVLTFDDGPWPDNTPAVLKALADNCLKATFFEIGEHAVWHPEIAKHGCRR